MFLRLPADGWPEPVSSWLLLLLTLSQDYAGLFPALQQLKEAGKALENFKGSGTLTAGERIPVQTSIETLLKVDRLSFGYQPGTPLLENFSLTIAPGQHTALLGESGRGKTTLAYLLTGLYPPEEGTIECSCHVAGNLQGCFVFRGSIRENFLHLHPDLSEEDMQSCLECAQLGSLAASLPLGLDTPLGYDGSRLSGGERNRLLTALALASPAPLLILDEPTAGLDKKTASRLLDGLFERARKRHQTLLVITHDSSILDRFSQVIEL